MSENDSHDDQKKPKRADETPFVALVPDPFGLNNLEIAEAQQESDELNLDEGLSAGESGLPEAFDLQDLKREIEGELDQMVQNNEATQDERLETLSQAMDEQEDLTRKAAEEIAGWTPDSEATDAKTKEDQLAKEIADDQALQAELKREAEEEEQADPELQAALPKADPGTGALDIAELQSCIESLLFMLDKPVSLERLRSLLGPDAAFSYFQEALTGLRDKYAHPSHGIEIVEVANGIQFRTKPGRAALARKLSKTQVQRLSAGAMETLAIVAYRQPVMKEDVDKIRGVDSSYFVRLLLDKKVIAITGRSELPGRPMLYGTTDEFLSLFNLKDLAALPSLREIEAMVPTSQGGRPGDEDPPVREMRRLVNQMTTDTSTTLNYDPKEDETILKEIRERVNAIPTSTPYLEEQKAAEKAAAELAKAAAAGAAPVSAEGGPAEPELPLSPDAPAPVEPELPGNPD